jgi:choline dehydrogenase-like flavoprotein
MSATGESRYSADVVIIGAGVAGATAAYELSRLGHRVLMIDAGRRIDRGTAVNTFRASPTKGNNAPYPQDACAPVPDDLAPWSYYVQEGVANTAPNKFAGLYLKAVGGTTWHMTAHAERFYPNDFRMQSMYGRGVDWPIAYSDLEPHYTRAEREWGVSGQTGISISPDRHGLPYPMGPIPPTYLDHRVAAAAEALGLTVAPFPHGRNSSFYDDRPACCGNANCNAICPVAAKYDASVHVAKAEALGAQVLDRTVVYAIDVNPDGQDDRIEKVRFRRFDGSEGSATGKVFLLAAHAIETPKLLLMSKSERTPNGVANRSDQVGRNLMGQLDVTSVGVVSEPVYPYRGPVSATSGILEYRDGPHRKDYAAFGTFILNGGPDPRLGPLTLADQGIARGLFGAALRDHVAATAARQVGINCSVEVLPDAGNRVEPDTHKMDALGLPYPKITYALSEYTLKGGEVAEAMQKAVISAMGAKIDDITTTIGTSTAIIAGTARMGTDPATSVVDGCCRSHDHRNLYIVGNCNFPTSTFSSPSLTTAALALRAAAQIAVAATQG